jgi:hypothetical protein
VREVPSHPLLMWAAGHVARLPFLTLPFRLNLMAAAAGALAVGWVFKVVWFIVFEVMREESAVMHASRNARFAAGWRRWRSASACRSGRRPRGSSRRSSTRPS